LSLAFGSGVVLEIVAVFDRLAGLFT
jgi:hypothetical protein